jgi:putative transposase
MERRIYTELYVHLVWGTWLRRRFLRGAAREQVFACIHADCDRMRCAPLAIGGTDDHVHVLIRLGTSVTIGGVVKQLKGASSHLMNHTIQADRRFRWQIGYGAFTVSRRHLSTVTRYVLHQEEHHRTGRLLPPLERSE